ncbi:hypothetical protein [Vallitalea guaymasensis]|uniref:hypothetical protein n=1 Tax=Vallitalea guaymasensis TaxID=1185412 RepID=UPI000DE338E2|nr:hypothetical protein [Vallitalea guaymasensis]
MARIDIRDLDNETLDQIDKQCKMYDVKSRSDYIRLLINMDIMTNIVKKIQGDSHIVFDSDTLEKIDKQCQKYDINNRTDYLKLLINLDLITDIVDKIKN